MSIRVKQLERARMIGQVAHFPRIERPAARLQRDGRSTDRLSHDTYPYGRFISGDMILLYLRLDEHSSATTIFTHSSILEPALTSIFSPCWFFDKLPTTKC